MISTFSYAAELVKNGEFSQDFTSWGHNRCHIQNGVVIDCKNTPEGSVGETIVSDPLIISEKFLRMVRGDYQYQATYQFIGNLVPGKTYRLRVKAKTPVGSTVMFNLYNKDWTSTDGLKKGKSFTTTLVSTSSTWKTLDKFITVPQADDFGHSTSSNRWYVYLYSNQVANFIEYDQVSLTDISVPAFRTNLLADAITKATSKTSCWRNDLRGDGTVEMIKLVKADTCPVAESKLIETDLGETTQLMFNGGSQERLKRVTRYYTVSVRPDTLYQISAKFQYTQRKCEDVLKFGENYTKTASGFPTPILLVSEKVRSYGVSCGNVSFDLIDQSPDRWNGKTMLTRGISLLSPRVTDAPYLDEKNVEPFTEARIFRTGPNQTSMQIQFVINGFVGKVSVSDLKLIEASESYVAPPMLVAPTTSFGGMKLVSYSAINQGHVITTTAGKWTVSANEILISRNGKTSGRLKFYPGTLSNLIKISQPAVLPSPGRIELANERIRLHFYSDSTMSALLRKEQPVTVTGLEGAISKSHKTFDAGVALDLDLEQDRGLFFSPMELNRLNYGLPEINLKLRMDFKYPESFLHQTGFRFWDVAYQSTSQGNIWNKITYHFKRLDTFIVGILPPKPFDPNKICDERFHSVNINFNELRSSADIQSAATQAKINLFKSHFNIVMFWQNTYSSTNTDAPFYRYVSKRVLGETVTPPTVDDWKLCYSNQVRRDGEDFLPSGSAYNNIPCKFALDRYSVRGHYRIAPNKTERFQELVQKLKSQGLRVIVYLSPEFYYTTDVATFVTDLQALKALGVEGVYYDGLYQRQPWKARELVLKTRQVFGANGFYVQHRSFENTLLPRSTRVRAHFLDVHASQLLVGEGVKQGFDGRSAPPTSGLSLWSVFYSGRLLSNTPTTLLPETRPVRMIYDPITGALDHEASIHGTTNDTISPQAQITSQIAGGGSIYVPIVSSTDQVNTVPFNDRVLKNLDGSTFRINGPLVNEYWRQFDQSCSGN